MKKRKPITLIATAILAIVFMFVFVINMTSTVRKDSKSDNLSLSDITSYAQNGTVDGGQLGEVDINCSGGYQGKCFYMETEISEMPSYEEGVEVSVEAWCEWSGSTSDYCDWEKCVAFMSGNLL